MSNVYKEEQAVKKRLLSLFLDETLSQLRDVEILHESNRILGDSSEFKELFAALLMVQANLKKIP